MAATSAEPDYADAPMISVDEASEGADLAPSEEGVVESEAPGQRHGAAPPQTVDEANVRLQEDRGSDDG
jgi:hypothetical protein